MRKLLSFFRDRHALLYKGFLFAAGLFLIVYLYPRDLRYSYDTAELKGQKWTHDDLVAPFGFAIQKSDDELLQEENEIRSKFIPYFNYDTTVVENTEQNLFNSLSPLDPSDRRRILTAVDAVYKNGIRAVTNNAHKGPQDKILLVKRTIASEHRLQEFPDPTVADSLVARKLQGKALDFWKKKEDIFLPANILYDSIFTMGLLGQQIDNISLLKGAVSERQVIVHRGDVVDEETLQKLISLQNELKIKSGEGEWERMLGQILLTGIILFILFRFLRLFRREVLGNDSRLLFILILLVLTVCMSYLPSFIDNLPLLAMPFCILPVIMRAFFDTRLALFVHLLAILLISAFLPSDRFNFLFIQVLAGIIAIFSIANMRNRSQLFISVVFILCGYALLEFGLLVVSEGKISAINTADMINYAISAVLVLLAFPLIYVFEKLFGFVSDVTLMELADTNNPLLRELAEKAPGTFQHSIQVANLAEEAIRRIGGNTLLVRAGALYHDIGKADMAIYFIENQAAGMNPHDELTFEESASIIISHVIKGIEKAKAAKLPDQVVDFIRTHHGTTKTAYFLTLFRKNNPTEDVDDELFRYPGPIPYSKETAVLMMADSVEASSRSLKKYDADSIDALIESVIENQADLRQFDNSDLTLKDITEIKKIFKKKLRSIYHVRVEYPK
ncbi:MAG TPA: HDIG domain-containing protein [Bacteroidia bacterium]|jgi:putative nucleotidyltransferase with HDIG domain|nr:HDIG domain-containing protein [Bacteroidia bacterium]